MQITLNGKAKFVGDYRRLTYENICALIGEFSPGNGNVVTITYFNRKTKKGGTLSPAGSVAVNRNLVVTAVRTARA
jgi:hypothetical protein